MGFKEWIIPQDRVFYDLLEQQAGKAQEAVAAFRHMTENWDQLEAERQKVKAIESAADEIGHQIFARLNRTFITPIDREDIARLAHVLDDVVDSVFAAANRIAMVKLAAPTEPMTTIGSILDQQVTQVLAAVRALRKPNSMAKMVGPISIEIHRLENEADRTLRHALVQLFATNDPMNIIRHKEIYEFLELATDKCEDVANVLSDIVRKHG
jgi:predicted phosphate transport protein (TIGR00153 family)